MSWNATLIDDRGHEEHRVNYTHNTNGMIGEALKSAGMDQPETENGFWSVVGPQWWKQLDEMPGADSVKYLGTIIDQFEKSPDKYRAMNPDNGWGSYDQLLGILKDMRNAVPEWPTAWSVSG